MTTPKPEVVAQREYAATQFDDFADLIDRGPTFPLPASIFSAMAREKAEDLRAAGSEGTPA
jgi:hypothetical protein